LVWPSNIRGSAQGEEKWKGLPSEKTGKTSLYGGQMALICCGKKV